MNHNIIEIEMKMKTYGLTDEQLGGLLIRNNNYQAYSVKNNCYITNIRVDEDGNSDYECFKDFVSNYKYDDICSTTGHGTTWITNIDTLDKLADNLKLIYIKDVRKYFANVT